jgi:hypothetical protein
VLIDYRRRMQDPKQGSASSCFRRVCVCVLLLVGAPSKQHLPSNTAEVGIGTEAVPVSRSEAERGISVWVWRLRFQRSAIACVSRLWCPGLEICPSALALAPGCVFDPTLACCLRIRLNHTPSRRRSSSHTASPLRRPPFFVTSLLLPPLLPNTTT